MGDRLHRLRRWWWRLTVPAPRNLLRCHDCGNTLTPEERQYYGWNCELCEGINAEAGEFDARPMRRMLERLTREAAAIRNGGGE
jgi:ribosomal protein L37AE/L43A